MQEVTQNAEATAEGMVDEQQEKKSRKSPEREEVKLSENPSALLSKEGFALYIGKTVDAIVSMAKASCQPFTWQTR